MEASITGDKTAEVRSQIERDIARAQEFEILNADIEKARLTIGIDVAHGAEGRPPRVEPTTTPFQTREALTGAAHE